MSTLVPTRRRVWLLVRSNATSLIVATAAVAALGAVLLGRQPGAWLDLTGSGLVVLGAAYSLILTSRIVSGDLEGGALQVWLQKPVPPVRFYLARFVDATVAWGALTVLAVVAARSATAMLGWTAPTDLLTALPRILLTVLSVASIAFGLSAWIVRGGTFVAVVVALAGMIVEEELAVHGSRLGPTATSALRAVLFPESSLANVGHFMAGETDALWGALARIVLHAAAWIGIGAWGVRRAVRHGGLARAQGG